MGLIGAGVACAFGVSLLAGGARASDTFLYTAVPASNNPAATPGATLQYLLFLQETVSGGTTSLLSSAKEDGLFGAGVSLTPTVSTAASTIASIAGDATDFSNQTPPGTTGNGIALGNGGYGLTESVPFAPLPANGVLEGNAGGSTVSSPNTPSNDVFLGIATITVGAGTTTFKVGELNNQGGNTVSFHTNYDLDTGPSPTGADAYTPIGATVTSFTISTPEPASLGLLGLGAAAALYRRRRKA